MEYYHHLLLTEIQFGLLGQLLNEYLVDMFSSVEDSRLNYIRQHVQTQHGESWMRSSMQKVDWLAGSEGMHDVCH